MTLTTKSCSASALHDRLSIGSQVVKVRSVLCQQII